MVSVEWVRSQVVRLLGPAVGLTTEKPDIRSSGRGVGS